MRASLTLRSALGGLALPWRTITLSTLALALYLTAGPAPELLIYDRAAIAVGEWWRLITGHWVHSDASHGFWDIAALAVLGVLFESRLGGGLFRSLAMGTLMLDAWLWWAMPDLTRYCGLSGVLNTLLAAGLLHCWQETRDPLILWVALAAIGKIGLELMYGGALLTQTAWPSLPAAHAVGFATGALTTLKLQAPAQVGTSEGRSDRASPLHRSLRTGLRIPRSAPHSVSSRYHRSSAPPSRCLRQFPPGLRDSPAPQEKHHPQDGSRRFRSPWRDPGTELS